MQTTTPLISVAMPVYNAQQYLAEAIDSILAQTLGDFELIAVNDGSTDASQEIIERYARRDPRVRLVNQPNGGIANALNTAIRVSTGKYIARMDGDDIALPERFQRQVEYLESHPECVCLGTQVMVIEPLGSPLHVAKHELTHEEIDRVLMSGTGWAIVHPTAMMRREHVLEVGCYREQYSNSEDLDLFLRLAEQGKLANLPEVLLKYRHHPQSTNFTKHAIQTGIKNDIMRDAYARRGLTLPEGKEFTIAPPLPLPEQFTRWAWAALKAGNVPAARKHAATAVKKSPLNPAAWKVMLCAVRGR